MAAALSPLRARMPKAVREREVLRVAGTIPHQDLPAAVAEARRNVLAWAQRRSGSKLSKEAWNSESFELMRGGRLTLGARILEEGIDLWGLRGDDPDKDVPGRTWTTEVAIGQQPGEPPRISLRLLVSSAEDELDIEPSVPGLLLQIASSVGLRVGGFGATAEAQWARTEEEVEWLIDLIESRQRRLPVFIATGDERADDPDRPLIDVAALAKATCGLAHVFVVPASATYALSDAFGKLRSVYHGAVRAYMPGFDSASDPHEHPLRLGDAVALDPAKCVRDLRWFAATESVRRTRLGHDVMPFDAVRSVALRIEQELSARSGATDAEQLATAKRRLAALEEALEKQREQAELNAKLAEDEEERAKAAEALLRKANARVQHLDSLLKERGQDPDADLVPPTRWEELADWCDEKLTGRLVLAPAARRGVRKPEFADVALAGRCLVWLATTCRDRRMNGGGSLANVAIEAGIENAPCGGDTFRFDFHGHRLDAEWHIKNGGNTRNPSLCLRIYYAWYEATQQIVVAEMPAHRHTDAT
jgi:hypothetical protein